MDASSDSIATHNIMTTLTQNRPGLSAPPQATPTTRLVSVVAGGHELALVTDRVQGVFQLSPDHAGADLETVSTPSGEMPVVSLALALHRQLGAKVGDSSHERTLLAIRFQDETFAIRVQAVSRPILVEDRRFQKIPLIARPHDAFCLVSSLATINPLEEDPAQALRLVIDPVAALGARSPTPSSQLDEGEASTFSHNFPRTSASAVGTKERAGRRGSGQQQLFFPEQATTEAEYVFGLPIAMVAEVVTVPKIVELPIEAPHFEGYAMWRGAPIPVLKLGDVFFPRLASATSCPSGVAIDG